MSKDDGIPEWLEPIKPEHADATANSTSKGSSVSGQAEYQGIICASGVHGALIELEKWVPIAGLALVQEFFPSGLSYNDARIRDNVHKKFRGRAYATQKIRKKAEEKRRAEEERGKLHSEEKQKLAVGPGQNAAAAQADV